VTSLKHFQKLQILKVVGVLNLWDAPVLTSIQTLDNAVRLLQTMGNLKIRENNLFQEATDNIICYIKYIMHLYYMVL